MFLIIFIGVLMLLGGIIMFIVRPMLNETEERAQIDKETAIGVAQAIAGPEGLTLPDFYVSGQDSKSTNSTDMLTQIMTMMLVQQEQTKKKVK